MWIPSAFAKDHPRLCGEKSPLWYNNRRGEGSPPPMRGKGSSRCSAMHRRRDHPRLCGEKVELLSITKPLVGSPPPMRGKARRASMTLHRSGITPAYAGKSSRIPRLHLRDRDHPRLCGEKPERVSINDIKAGSPPPMRGKD